jgi:hypothetical protein
MKFYILALYGDWTHLSCNTKLLLSLLKGHKSALHDTAALHCTLPRTRHTVTCQAVGHISHLPYNYIEAVTCKSYFVTLVQGNVGSSEWVYQECKLNVTMGNRYSTVNCRHVPCALRNVVL